MGGRVNPVAPRSVRDTAADLAIAYIKKQIWLGVLRPGDRIPLTEIAPEIGVSPTPVREAVAALAEQGRVVVHNHRGAFVGPFDAEHLTDHYDLLGTVYGWAARRAAQRLSPTTRAELRRLSAALAVAESDDDLFAVVKTIEQTIYATAGSYSAQNAARTLEGVVPGNIYSWVESSGELVREQMPRIVSAICTGRADLAARRAGEFFTEHGAMVIAQLRSNGVLSETGYEDETESAAGL
ncbi:MAG TPA: GntR family transcriptional regulator [Jatrophihabitans sp.]|jgi:DNA-binding GntR family transcriptional regulator